jgi:Holliday junction resolvase RusA-like endonuclease
MSQALSFTVPGVPIPQGSKKSFPHPVTGKMVIVEDNPKTKPWRQTMTVMARNAVVRHGHWLPLEKGVVVGLRFYLPRPESVSRLQRLLPWVKPDIDKLTRAALDSMSAAKVYADDAKVVELHVYKFYADECPPCVKVTVEEWSESP